MNVRLTADARTDLAQIRQHASHSGTLALVLAAIVRALRALKTWPRLGRPGTVDGTREFLVRRLPFVIVYRLDIGDEDELVVLRLYHIRQDR